MSTFITGTNNAREIFLSRTNYAEKLGNYKSAKANDNGAKYFSTGTPEADYDKGVTVKLSAQAKAILANGHIGTADRPEKASTPVITPIVAPPAYENTGAAHSDSAQTLPEPASAVEKFFNQVKSAADRDPEGALKAIKAGYPDMSDEKAKELLSALQQGGDMADIHAALPGPGWTINILSHLGQFAYGQNLA